MATQQTKDSSVILRDVHCPFCNTDQAFLINSAKQKKISIQYPAFGLKYVLSLLYLAFFHIWVNGYKLIEATKGIDSVTYGFCPSCGNSYSATMPEIAKEEMEEPKFYKVNDGKVIMGFCKGVSEYTGISLLWIRIMTVLYGLTVIGAIAYFIFSACIPFKEDVESGTADKRFYRIDNGRDIMGLCKGFSVYTGIPVMWVRIFTLMAGCTIVGAVLYFIIAAFLPVKENVERGIIRKKMYKIKQDKWLLGLCKGFSVYANMPLWVVRMLTILLVAPLALYFFFCAIIPTEEEDNAK